MDHENSAIYRVSLDQWSMTKSALLQTNQISKLSLDYIILRQ